MLTGKWRLFTEGELKTLKPILDDYCERYEDTCEAEEALANEVDDELKRRGVADGNE